MNSTTAVLHAGLLARKGEARPSAQTETTGLLRPGNVASFSDAQARREPPVHSESLPAASGRAILLPRAAVSPATATRSSGEKRHQIHARVPSELHLRMRIAASRGGRTQQDLVASALEAYLSFLDEDVYSPPCGARNAWV